MVGFSLIETKTFVARKNLINSANSRHSVEFELFSSFNVFFLKVQGMGKGSIFRFSSIFFAHAIIILTVCVLMDG